MKRFTSVRDSGKRIKTSTGMVRDTDEGKPRYDLIFPLEMENTIFDRLATHLANGAVKYSARNWEKAETVQEAERFRQSFLRHVFQWTRGLDDEDHLAAILFNLQGFEYVLEKLRQRLTIWKDHTGMWHASYFRRRGFATAVETILAGKPLIGHGSSEWAAIVDLTDQYNNIGVAT